MSSITIGQFNNVPVPYSRLETHLPGGRSPGSHMVLRLEGIPFGRQWVGKGRRMRRGRVVETYESRVSCVREEKDLGARYVGLLA